MVTLPQTNPHHGDAGPLVSVIVNNFNYGHFLADAIESALGQTYPHVEVIVVDDGSTDGSGQVIARFGEQIKAVFKQNEGQASTFNTGFQHSRGEVVLFLDADDMLLPSAVENAIGPLRDPNVVKVHWPMWEVNAAGERNGLLFPRAKLCQGNLRQHVICSGPVSLSQPPTSGNAWPRWFLRTILPLPEHEDKHGADGYLRKLAPAFGRIHRIEEPQGCYRIHADNYGGGRSQLFRFQRALRRYPTYCKLLSDHLTRLGEDADTQGWMAPGSEYAWMRAAVAVHETLASLIPRGEKLVFVGDAALGPEFLDNLEARPFFEREGVDWGPPPDDQHALTELRRVQDSGTRFLVFAFPAFWWFDQYRDFVGYLRDKFNCVCENDHVVVFRLDDRPDSPHRVRENYATRSPE